MARDSLYEFSADLDEAERTATAPEHDCVHIGIDVFALSNESAVERNEAAIAGSPHQMP